MSIVTFSVKGAHFSQKSDFDKLIPSSVLDNLAPASKHSIVIWHGADKSLTPASLSGEACDLVIWISNDFVSCQSVSISGITVPIWKCSTVTLLRHFAQLRDHLQKQAKKNWSPTAWIKDLELLRMLDILIQGYQLTHLNPQVLKTNRFSETTLAYLKARGDQMERPAWWMTGLGYGTAGAEKQDSGHGDSISTGKVPTETLKEALQHEAETASVSLNVFYDFLENKKDADFFSYIEGIRSGILNALPR